jgi:hypothetical protein
MVRKGTAVVPALDSAQAGAKTNRRSRETAPKAFSSVFMVIFPLSAIKLILST